MIWLKRNKIHALKNNFPEFKNIIIKGNDIKCTINNGVIDISSDDKALDGSWHSQFTSKDGKFVSIPETSKSLLNVVRKPLRESKEYAYYGYSPVSNITNKNVYVVQGANPLGLYVIQESNSFGTVKTPIKVVASSTLANKIKSHLENKYHQVSFSVYKVPFINKQIKSHTEK